MFLLECTKVCADVSFSSFLIILHLQYIRLYTARSGIVLGINWLRTFSNWWEVWLFKLGCNIHGEISFQTLQNFWVTTALMITRTKFFPRSCRDFGDFAFLCLPRFRRDSYISPRLSRSRRDVCVFLNLGKISGRSRRDYVKDTNIMRRLPTSRPDRSRDYQVLAKSHHGIYLAEPRSLWNCLHIAESGEFLRLSTR